MSAIAPYDLLSSGLRATRKVSKGQTIFAVPATQWITPEVVAKSELGPFVSHLQPWVQLALFIMAESANPRSALSSLADKMQPAHCQTSCSEVCQAFANALNASFGTSAAFKLERNDFLMDPRYRQVLDKDTKESSAKACMCMK